jgi:elongation factor P
MITTGDFKKGLRIELDGSPWAIVQNTTQSPSARGAATLVKARLKHVLTGQVIDRTFKSGDKFGEPDLYLRPAQYLYSEREDDGHVYHFMDTENYEQFPLRKAELGDLSAWLVENLEVRAISYNQQVVGIELPQFIELTVDSVEPGTKGDTTSGSVTTTAYTESGIRVQVPLFVKAGDKIRVDTESGSFKDRK